MTSATGLFDIECQGDTVIVTPSTDLGEFGYEQLVAESQKAMDLLDQTEGTRNAVINLQKTDYFGSTALGVFVKLWKRVRKRDGHMAFCGMSEHEREIIAVTKLDQLWSICDSQEAALKEVEAGGIGDRTSD